MLFFWNCINSIANALGENSIYHLCNEQAHSLSPNSLESVGKNLFDHLHSGISQMNPKKYFSICKHPHFFSKEAILYSSLSDISAYTTNKIQQKIEAEIPNSKIMSTNTIPLEVFTSVFNNYAGAPSSEAKQLFISVQAHNTHFPNSTSPIWR